MSTQIQRRKGTTAEHSTFTGAEAELTVDTTKDTVVVHDGVTAGGRPLLREDGTNSALALGSASTPSLKFTGDLNTGIYSPGADQVAISTNGTQRLAIDSSGNVTIDPNTVNPTLYIDAVNNRVGILTSSPQFSLESSSSQTNYIAQTHTSAGYSLAIGTTSQYGVLLNTSTTLPTAFWLNGAERMRITSDGKLGLGTSAPGQQMVVKGSQPFLEIRDERTGTWTGESVFSGILFGTDDASGAVDPHAFIKAVHTRAGTHSQADAGLTFGTSASSTTPATERMRIDEQGRVGIGDNGPDSTLTIKAATGITPFKVSGPSSEFAKIDSSGRLLVGTSTSRTVGNTPQILTETVNTSTGDRGITVINGGTAASGPVINFAKHRGNLGGQTVVNNNDYTGAIIFNGSDGTNFIQSAFIAAQVDGTPGANDMPGRLVFSTTADGASSPTERMRIKSTGIVNIINTPTYADNTAALAGGLVAGDIYRKSDGTLMITY